MSQIDLSTNENLQGNFHSHNSDLFAHGEDFHVVNENELLLFRPVYKLHFLSLSFIILQIFVSLRTRKQIFRWK